jgi:hypothetical protein
MPKPCSICVSPDREAIEQSVMNRISNRETARQFGRSASAVSRHRGHAGIEPDADDQPDPVAGGHLAAANKVIADFRRDRGKEFDSQDEAELLHLQSVAAAVDADPSNTALLRELRLTQAAHRRNAEDTGHGDGLSLAQFLAAAVAEARDS